MPSLLWSYVVILLCVLLFDSIYLYSIGGPWFKTQVADVQRNALEINYSAALLCYLIIAGLLLYIGYITQSKSAASEQEAFFIGFAVYAVFELTCKAIFIQWKWTTVLIDSVWGGILFALSLFASKKILRKYL